MKVANELFNFGSNEVKIVMCLSNDEPYFCGKDVAHILGYSNVNDALLKYVENEDKKCLKELNSKAEVNYHEEKAIYTGFFEKNCIWLGGEEFFPTFRRGFYVS